MFVAYIVDLCGGDTVFECQISNFDVPLSSAVNTRWHIEPFHLQSDKPLVNLSGKAVDRFSQKCMFESYAISTPENVK